MKKTAEYIQAVCPYFLNNRGCLVVCEGVIKGTTTSNHFKTERQVYMHQKRFCNTFNYRDCPLSVAIEKKYD